MPARTARALADSAGTLKRVLAILNDRLASTLAPQDFGRLGQRLAKGRSPSVVMAGAMSRGPIVTGLLIALLGKRC